MVSFLKSITDRQINKFAEVKDSLSAVRHSFKEYARLISAESLPPISCEIYSGLQAAINQITSKKPSQGGQASTRYFPNARLAGYGVV